MTDNGYAKAVLVTTDWLAEHLSDSNVVLAEVDENPDLYDESHIPGAVKLHWREDLQDPVERDLVEKDEFERLMGRRGIGNETTLVVYGDKNNWFAAYAYWYLKIYGHGDVRVLDGGRQKWIDEGRDLTVDVPQVEPVSYTARERDESIRAYRDAVRQTIGDEDHALVDVRSPQEFSGDLIAPPGYEQEGAQRAGHIPTAASIPWASAVRDDACALSRPLVLASAVEPAPDLSPRRASHALSGLPPHTVHAVPRRFGPCLEHPRAAPLARDRGHAGLGPRRGLAPRGRDRRDRGSRRPLQRCPHPVSSSGAGARTAPVVSHGPPPARAPSRR